MYVHAITSCGPPLTRPGSAARRQLAGRPAGVTRPPQLTEVTAGSVRARPGSAQSGPQVGQGQPGSAQGRPSCTLPGPNIPTQSNNHCETSLHHQWSRLEHKRRGNASAWTIPLPRSRQGHTGKRGAAWCGRTHRFDKLKLLALLDLLQHADVVETGLDEIAPLHLQRGVRL